MTQPARRRQSLLLVNQHYHPDVAASAQYTQDLAEYLVQSGYSVEVLCGRGHYVAGQMAVPLRDSLNGVGIRRVRTTSFGRGRHLGRVFDYASYKRRITRLGVPEDRTRTVHVWSDHVVPVPRDQNPLLDELGLRGKFVVMYSGNAGLVHDFVAILETMRRLRDDPSIYFLFVGAGPRRAEIERYALEHQLTNFEYRGYFPRDKVRWSLGLGDVHLISLQKPFVGVSVPGKLYGIMAAARPALFVGPSECESAQTILAAGCGAVVDPDDGDPAGRLVGAIRTLQNAPATVLELGKLGRAAFEERYDRVPNCRAWVELLQGAWPGVIAATDRSFDFASQTSV